MKNYFKGRYSQMKATKFLSLAGLVLLLCGVILLGGCAQKIEPETRTGKLVGVQVNFSLDDAMQGEINQVDFWGVVIVELDDGSKVDAAVDNDLAQILRGGDMLVIESVEGSEIWKVIGLAEASND
jgi:hypothetical protein